MKNLLVLRHAKSSWKEPGLGDHDRPLNKRGERDAPRMGRLIKQRGLQPEVILCSTAKRARDTAKLIADYSGHAREVQFIPDLYHAPPAGYLEVLTAQPDTFETVMVIGHNPGLEGLIEALSGQYHVFPTAALAHLAAPIDSWRDVADCTAAAVIDLWRPRELA